jgi:hypothetical protein
MCEAVVCRLNVILVQKGKKNLSSGLPKAPSKCAYINEGREKLQIARGPNPMLYLGS